MRLDARYFFGAGARPRWRTIDLDTGRQIELCVMADEEAGEYEQYVHTKDARGQPVFDLDPRTKRVRTVRGKARVEIQLLADDEPYLLEDARRLKLDLGSVRPDVTVTRAGG
jgi:hypothetical protein